MDNEDIEPEQVPDLVEEISSQQIAAAPTDTGDPPSVVAKNIPLDIRERFEVFSYRNAAVILNETRSSEFADLLKGLRDFRITKNMIRRAGGNRCN